MGQLRAGYRLALGVALVLAGFGGAAAQERAPAAPAHAADIVVFVREGCPHCAAAKEYLAELQRRRPELVVVLREVSNDRAALQDLQWLSMLHRVQAPGVPTFLIGDELIVGFGSPLTTGHTIEELLDRRKAVERQAQQAAAAESSAAGARHGANGANGADGASEVAGADAAAPAGGAGRAGAGARGAPPSSAGAAVDSGARAGAGAAGSRSGAPDTAAAPAGDAGSGAAAGSAGTGGAGGAAGVGGVAGEGPAGAPTAARSGVEVVLPLVGRVTPEEVGLPLFTVAIGLLDGVNPCAMWVLVFLLSILVALRSRWKMLLIGGIFVVTSGLVYYAFMAAWLNVFLLIGMSRLIQLSLGAVAITMGGLNLKDVVAFGKGVSLKIPDAARPGIYGRLRRIVTAERVIPMIAGAMVLAALVNTVELLCTAGLPALYTQVLTLRGLPTWKYYGYLGLYNVFYMLDDSIVLAIAVVTLSNRRLQQSEARWMKLVAGVLMLALGLALVFKPDWLTG